ncbi:MAG TPA: nickel-dependent hydrogenase large subunit [Chloroflexota bacterium]|nr:nickel-dependent hydrogenase large subunit [Chloroflexota bacterium]
MTYTIPIGPYHPALEEPCKIEISCEGEVIKDAQLHVGFVFRGVERLAQQKNYIQNIALVERICGICSNVHTMTYCMAVERLAGVEPTERARYIRVVVAELERLHSHILWAGIAAEVMGFQTLFMSCWQLREKVMDLLEAISGNRVNYAMNCIGGVNRDITDPDAVLNGVREIRREVERTMIPIFTGDRTIKARAAGVGVLTHEQAVALGTVGPTARASGVKQDIRKATPYAAYDRLEFQVPVQESGDVVARVVVRALEILESCSLVEQAVLLMPPGPLRGPEFVQVPPGEAIARAEAPRGEVFYYVASDGSDIPTRVKARTPTYLNLTAARPMVLGATLADVPLIQASIDPCYSCTDR